jgi:DNA-binding GntR family transcriptional regulator
MNPSQQDPSEMQQVDRDAYQPAYMQLVDILQDQIASGRYKPNDKLPSETQLCKIHGLSPMTVRRAINILVDRGYVNSVQGSGTYVRSPDMGEAVFQLNELKEHLNQRERVRVKLLEARIIPADARVVRKLQLEPDDWTVYIRRLLIEEETPITYHREYLLYDPARPIIEGEMEATFLEGLFRGGEQATMKGGHLAIEAVTLRHEEADLLQSSSGSAAFQLEHIFYDFKDRPISWGWFIWRADYLRFSAVIGLPPPQ